MPVLYTLLHLWIVVVIVEQEWNMEQRCLMDLFLKGRIIGRHKTGQSQAVVARTLNVPQCVISRLLRWYYDMRGIETATWLVQDCRKVNSLAGLVSCINCIMLQDNVCQATCCRVTAASGARVSRQTVCQRLWAIGLYAWCPAVCVPPMPAHRSAHLKWVRSMNTGLWISEAMCSSLTDDSRFSFKTDSCQTTLWKEQGTWHNLMNITERDEFGGSGVLVWAGIMWNDHTNLCIFNRCTAAVQMYRDKILEPRVWLFRGDIHGWKRTSSEICWWMTFSKVNEISSTWSGQQGIQIWIQ